jgi:GntR family transcriptional regulator
MWLEKTLERNGQEKLYIQVYSIIKEKIEKGDWQAGTQIPTEDGLCKTFNVSKATVRLAISELAKEGYIQRQQGKGTFVSFSSPQTGLAMKTMLTEDMFGEGVGVRKEILSKGLREPEEDIKELFAFDEGIYHILCRRVVDGEAACIEESFVPLFMFPGIEHADICSTPLYELIQSKALRKVQKVIQTVELSSAKDHVASFLKIEEGSPVLLLHRLLLGSDRIPIAYTRLFGSGRKYKLQTEFERIR